MSKKPNEPTPPSTSSYSAEWSKNHNVLGARLREERTLKRMSLQEVSNQLHRYDVHMRSATISKWELGLSIPTPYQVFALCHLLGIQNPMTLFAGGPAEGTELNDEGLRKLADYRTDLVLSGRYVVQADGPEEEEEEELDEYPFFDIAVAAGFGDYLDEGHFESKAFPSSVVPDGTDFVVRINGDSMMPRYQNGQYAFVEKCDVLNPGEIGIFAVDGSAFIKKYTEREPDEEEWDEYELDCMGGAMIELISLNKKYKPITVPPTSSFRIYGRVLNREGWGE